MVDKIKHIFIALVQNQCLNIKNMPYTTCID